jgi:CBS domain containing-hemolysin-like protein
MLMGFFAGIEMAFYSANRLSIEIKKKQGVPSTQILSKFVESPARFLGTTLIGFTIFLVFFGLQISTVLSPLWTWLNIKANLIHILAEIVIATFIVLVFAEFIPRAIFRARSNVMLNRMVYVTDMFSAKYRRRKAGAEYAIDGECPGAPPRKDPAMPGAA